MDSKFPQVKLRQRKKYIQKTDQSRSVVGRDGVRGPNTLQVAGLTRRFAEALHPNAKCREIAFGGARILRLEALPEINSPRHFSDTLLGAKACLDAGCGRSLTPHALPSNVAPRHTFVLYFRGCIEGAVCWNSVKRPERDS